MTNELMQAKMLRAVLTERQLEEVLVDFWFNHFNVFIGKGQVRQYLTEYERDAIRPHVLGSFRDMLGATAHSPAMLFYLDNFQSQAPEGSPVLAAPNSRIADMRRQPQPPIVRPGQVRPASCGLARCGRDKSRRHAATAPTATPASGPQRELRARADGAAYARRRRRLHAGRTSSELARILTGWTIDRPQQGGEFLFRPQSHDAGEKLAARHEVPGRQRPGGGRARARSAGAASLHREAHRVQAGAAVRRR